MCYSSPNFSVVGTNLGTNAVIITGLKSTFLKGKINLCVYYFERSGQTHSYVNSFICWCKLCRTTHTCHKAHLCASIHWIYSFQLKKILNARCTIYMYIVYRLGRGVCSELEELHPCPASRGFNTLTFGFFRDAPTIYHYQAHFSHFHYQPDQSC